MNFRILPNSYHVPLVFVLDYVSPPAIIYFFDPFYITQLEVKWVAFTISLQRPMIFHRSNMNKARNGLESLNLFLTKVKCQIAALFNC